MVVGASLTEAVRPQNTRGHWGPPLSTDPWYRIQGMGLVDNGGTTPPMAVGQDRLIQPPPTRSCMPLRGAAPSRRGWENTIPTPLYARWQEAPLPVTGGQSSIRWLTTGVFVGPLPAAGFVEPPGPPPPDGPPKAVHLQPPQAEGGECPQFFPGPLQGGNAREFFPRRFSILFGVRIMCIFFPHTLGGIMCIFSFPLPHSSLLTESCPTLGLTFSFVL